MTETNHCRCKTPKPLKGNDILTGATFCRACKLPLPSPTDKGNDELISNLCNDVARNAEKLLGGLVKEPKEGSLEWATPDPKELSWEEEFDLMWHRYLKENDRAVVKDFIRQNKAVWEEAAVEKTKEALKPWVQPFPVNEQTERATLAERNRIIALVEGMRKEEAPFDPSEVIDAVERTVRVYKMAYNIAFNDLLSALSKDR